MFISAASSTRQFFLENWQTFSNSTYRLLTSNKVILLALTVFSAFAALYYLGSRSIGKGSNEIKNNRGNPDQGHQEERLKEIDPPKTPERKLRRNFSDSELTPPRRNQSSNQEIKTGESAETLIVNGLKENHGGIEPLQPLKFNQSQIKVIGPRNEIWRGWAKDGKLEGDGWEEIAGCLHPVRFDGGVAVQRYTEPEWKKILKEKQNKKLNYKPEGVGSMSVFSKRSFSERLSDFGRSRTASESNNKKLASLFFKK